MGLFSFFNRKQAQPQDFQSSSSIDRTNRDGPPEEVFIEKDKADNYSSDDQPDGKKFGNGIELLFEFLEKNFEAKGYDDALINPDNTHMQQNLEALKNEMKRVIRKVKTFYEDFIRETDFHISSRSRSGMIDIVEELSMKKATAESHMIQVEEIEKDAVNNEGLGQGIIVSYTRGFQNGLAAISHHSILRKNI